MRTPLRRNQSSSTTRVVRKNNSQSGNGNYGSSNGNPRELHQKYLNLAREAISAGNIIEAEQFYQHAEHYYRVVAERSPAPSAPVQPQAPAPIQPQNI